MIFEIIVGITISGVFIGFSKLFSPKPKELYPEICITEYYELQELKWFDDSDDE